MNIVLFRIKDLQTSEMAVKLKSNSYVGLVNIFLKFWDCNGQWGVSDYSHKSHLIQNDYNLWGSKQSSVIKKKSKY